MNLSTITNRIWQPRFQGSVSEWCSKNLRFDEAGNHGPFTTHGAEYTTEVLNDFADHSISDEVLVWGSQTRKTGTLMGGVAWCVQNDPCGFLWVMPSIELARKFSRQRWQKLIENSIPDVLPRGAKRHNWATLEQVLANATINFVGSNSASGLASNPCRRVILDEVEKFNESPNSEADAVNLAEQRTKNQPSPQRWKTSTPALTDGLIWQEFMKGDQRRYHVPCPHCQKDVIFAWSKQFTVFPLTGLEAFVHWDQEARTKDGWDMDRVQASAHSVCPHCAGRIEDKHKTLMVRNGKWVASVRAPLGFVSRHLPSMYSVATECSFGRLAVKFLQAKQALTGLQGFINGDLAEPYIFQDTISSRPKELTDKQSVGDDWVKIMTVDCQMKSPLFWFVVRAWKRDCGSEAIDSGGLNSWEEVELKQKEHAVKNHMVVVDSRFGAKSMAQIYRVCAQYPHSDVMANPDGTVKKIEGSPLLLGWIPSKGFGANKSWKSKDGTQKPYGMLTIDPFMGTELQGKCKTQLLEFNSDAFQDILHELGKNNRNFKWTVSDKAGTRDYWLHWDAEIKTMIPDKRGKIRYGWKARISKAPNHLRDCEKMQVATAAIYGLLTIDPPKS